MALTWPPQLQSLAPEQRARLLLASLQSGGFPDLWQEAMQKADVRPVPLQKFSAPADMPVAQAVTQAATRTGLAPEALVAIIDAEAARDSQGQWKSSARNPHSSALGLGQFLARTWVQEAERAGTWLHQEATRRGWLDAAGKVVEAARKPLLALRADARASIEAVADYARHNLRYLQKKGVALPEDGAAQARLAYLGHHLGAGDALRFVQGRLSQARGAHLLAAQIGEAAAQKRIAAAGDGATAHRQWLQDYISHHVDSARLRRLA